jgi:hypothetical protein
MKPKLIQMETWLMELFSILKNKPLAKAFGGFSKLSSILSPSPIPQQNP